MGAIQPEATALRAFDDLPAPKGLPVVGNVTELVPLFDPTPGTSV